MSNDWYVQEPYPTEVPPWNPPPVGALSVETLVAYNRRARRYVALSVVLLASSVVLAVLRVANLIDTTPWNTAAVYGVLVASFVLLALSIRLRSRVLDHVIATGEPA